MVSNERACELGDLAPGSIRELTTAAQHATAAAYPNGVGSPDDVESKRCLNFRMEVASFEDLKQCLLIIGAYNYFDGEEVADAFRRHFPAEDVDGGNIASPNGLVVEIAREGSPALYVFYSYNTFSWNEPTISEKEFEERCEAFANDAKAQEQSILDCDWGDRRGTSCRVWWD